MKRSEMEGTIGSFLYNFRHRIGKIGLIDDDARKELKWLSDNLLNKLEEAGMLPPPSKKIIEMKILSYGLMYKGDHPEKYPDKIHHQYTEEWSLEWEPEDV